jgi:hypothetical protein
MRTNGLTQRRSDDHGIEEKMTERDTILKSINTAPAGGHPVGFGIVALETRRG